MGLGFYCIQKSYLVYETLCVAFGTIQLRFSLQVKVVVESSKTCKNTFERLDPQITT